jgi:hypothetical protein
VLDKDGSGKAYGIACTGGNLGDMTFEGNTITSNILNVALSDEYGACGNHPLYIRNTFVKADNYPAYKTFASELGGYFESTGRLVSNSFRNGASEKNININAAGNGRQSFYFGREIAVSLANSPERRPIEGALLVLRNVGSPFDSSSTTDAAGNAKLIVYDYELHDANNTSNSILTRYLAPHTIQIVIGADKYTTRSDSSASIWDYKNDRGGTFAPPLYLGDHLYTGKSLTLTY